MGDSDKSINISSRITEFHSMMQERKTGTLDGRAVINLKDQERQTLSEIFSEAAQANTPDATKQQLEDIKRDYNIIARSDWIPKFWKRFLNFLGEKIWKENYIYVDKKTCDFLQKELSLRSPPVDARPEKRDNTSSAQPEVVVPPAIDSRQPPQDPSKEPEQESIEEESPAPQPHSEEADTSRKVHSQRPLPEIAHEVIDEKKDNYQEGRAGAIPPREEESIQRNPLLLQTSDNIYPPSEKQRTAQLFRRTIPLAAREESAPTIPEQKADQSDDHDESDVISVLEGYEEYQLLDNEEEDMIQAYDLGCEAKEKKQLDYAIAYFKHAASLGSEEAIIKLGECYIEQNRLKEAFETFSTGAKKGNADALYNLGRCYQQGLGVATNQEQALIYFEAAAEKGNAHAQKILRELFPVHSAGTGEALPPLSSLEEDTSNPFSDTLLPAWAKHSAPKLRRSWTLPPPPEKGTPAWQKRLLSSMHAEKQESTQKTPSKIEEQVRKKSPFLLKKMRTFLKPKASSKKTIVPAKPSDQKKDAPIRKQRRHLPNEQELIKKAEERAKELQTPKSPPHSVPKRNQRLFFKRNP